MQDLEVTAGDRAFVIYDLSTSKHLPPEVVGFDHDLPAAGEDGPGGPVLVGSAGSPGRVADPGAKEPDGSSEAWAASREDSVGGASRQPGVQGGAGGTQGEAAAKAAAAGESAQEVQAQQQRRLRWQQQEQVALARLSLNMPFMGGTRINTSS